MAGLGHLWSDSILRALAVGKGVSGLGDGIFGALIVIYGIKTLGFAPGVLGTIFAVGGAAAVLGALGTGRIAPRFGLGRTLAMGLLLGGLSSFLIPLARGLLLLAGAFLVAAQLSDFGLAVYEINEVSLRQGIASPRMLGRVNASMRVIELSGLLVGSLLAGLLAETVGVRWALAAGASFGSAAGIWLMLSPVSKVRSDPESGSQPAAQR
ncbi:MAG: MFS transporter [Chloroflexi bacterium]|nr:MFS transporter [Chloroflexota bacterium]